MFFSLFMHGFLVCKCSYEDLMKVISFRAKYVSAAIPHTRRVYPIFSALKCDLLQCLMFDIY